MQTMQGNVKRRLRTLLQTICPCELPSKKAERKVRYEKRVTAYNCVCDTYTNCAQRCKCQVVQMLALFFAGDVVESSCLFANSMVRVVMEATRSSVAASARTSRSNNRRVVRWWCGRRARWPYCFGHLAKFSFLLFGDAIQ